MESLKPPTVLELRIMDLEESVYSILEKRVSKLENLITLLEERIETLENHEKNK